MPLLCRLRFTTLLIVSELVLLSLAPAALAHSRLLSSQPADGAVLNAAPAQVVLQFSARPEVGFSQVQWLDGKRWQVLPSSTDGKQLTAVLPPLAVGRQTLRWSVLSRDGHRQNGSLAFTVR